MMTIREETLHHILTIPEKEAIRIYGMTHEAALRELNEITYEQLKNHVKQKGSSAPNEHIQE